MNDLNRYYEILGLKPDASQAEVKQAYRKLVKTLHPDIFPDAPQLKQKAEEEIKKINEAYEKVKFCQTNYLDINDKNGITSTHLSNAETYYTQGMENAKRGKYTEAIENFTKAIRFNSNHVKAYKYRGLACSKLGYENRARSDLKKATKLELKQRKTEPQSASSSTPPKPSPTTSSPASPHSTSPWKCAHTLTGHSNWVFSIAISPDGQTLASGSSDKTIKIWHLSTGKLLHTLTEHSEWVRSVVFSPDGQILVSGSDDKTIKIWNLATGQLLRTLTGHSAPVWSVAISPDGQTLASGSQDKTIKIWHLGIEQLLHVLKGHSNWVNSVAFSPDRQTIASGSYDKTIKLWQLRTGKQLATLTGHHSYIWCIAFSPDGETLVQPGRSKPAATKGVITGVNLE